jgi:hypothetical protein
MDSNVYVGLELCKSFNSLVMHIDIYLLTSNDRALHASFNSLLSVNCKVRPICPFSANDLRVCCKKSLSSSEVNGLCNSPIASSISCTSAIRSLSSWPISRKTLTRLYIGFGSLLVRAKLMRRSSLFKFTLILKFNLLMGSIPMDSNTLKNGLTDFGITYYFRSISLISILISVAILLSLVISDLGYSISRALWVIHRFSDGLCMFKYLSLNIIYVQLYSSVQSILRLPDTFMMSLMTLFILNVMFS